MRAREFILEQKDLPAEYADPMKYTYVLPGLSAADPYQNYRMGVAMARARADQSTDNTNDFMPEWSADTAFGEHAVVSGFNAGIAQVIDQALKMTNTPGGKTLVGTKESEEPSDTNNASPIKGFKGFK